MVRCKNFTYYNNPKHEQLTHIKTQFKKTICKHLHAQYRTSRTRSKYASKKIFKKENHRSSERLTCSWWAEGDGIIGVTAGESTGGIVVSVAIRRRASGLENLRVLVGRARLRGAMVTRAAVLRSPEGGAGAFASNHPPVAAPDTEHRRAAAPEIGNAPGRPAVPGAARRGDAQGNIVTVDEAHVVEVLVTTDCELCQGDGRHSTGTLAHQAVCAVASGAGAGTRGVEIAASAAPEAARPARWGIHGSGLPGCQGEAAIGQGRPAAAR